MDLQLGGLIAVCGSLVGGCICALFRGSLGRNLGAFDAALETHDEQIGKLTDGIKYSDECCRKRFDEFRQIVNDMKITLALLQQDTHSRKRREEG